MRLKFIFHLIRICRLKQCKYKNLLCIYDGNIGPTGKCFNMKNDLWVEYGQSAKMFIIYIIK